MGVHLLPPLFKLLIEGGLPYVTTDYRGLVDTANNTSIRMQQVTVPWATLHDATAGTSMTTKNTSTYPSLRAVSTRDRFWWIDRAFYAFVVSGIAGKVKSGTLSVYLATSTAYGWTNQVVGLYGATPANPGSYVLGDYDQVGTTPYSDTYVGCPVAAGMKTFPLNAAGLAAMANGVVCLSLRWKSDADNIPPAWGSGYNVNNTFIATINTPPGANDAKLTLEHQ